MIRSGYPRTRRAKKGNHSKRIYKESVLSKAQHCQNKQTDKITGGRPYNGAVSSTNHDSYT